VSRLFQQITIGVCFLLVTGCSVALQKFPPVIRKAMLPVGFVMPYGLMFANAIAGMSSTYPDGSHIKGLYRRGVIATPWYTYKQLHYGFGTTLYRYRIISYVTKYHSGYGLYVRAPVEKQTSQGWTYVYRDKNIEQRAWQDLVNYISRSNPYAPKLWSRKKYNYNPSAKGLRRL